MARLRLGLIGLGLMGQEVASAAARWPHLPSVADRLEITAICSRTLKPATEAWYRRICGRIEVATTDYREVLASDAVDAVYIAVPHNLHREMYVAAIEAGKHLLGEKPFGIDLSANRAIIEACEAHPDVFVRCTSQFPFAPAVQRIGRMIEAEELGDIIEVEAGFKHSSDLNPKKPINWKRVVETNGEYGVMGDLGLHVCHVPFRAGYRPLNVRAILSNIVPERPGPDGTMVACETWDNAVLLAEAVDRNGTRFPMTLKTQRIAPGETNTWYLAIYGTRKSVRFSTLRMNQLSVLDFSSSRQDWCTVNVGHEVTFESITGGIFEFGFSDAMLQMLASFVLELSGASLPCLFAGCATPAEAALSHRLFTAALESHKNRATVVVDSQ